jgi:pSer/pThr/pTyr-binding forkhead associated (FHA) protein
MWAAPPAGPTPGKDSGRLEASLVLISSDFSQRTIPLTKSHIVIGRQTDCSIRIPAASVSRRHCEVVIDDDEVYVKDLGSSNGTYVNGKRVEETELDAGDLISIGQWVFVVRIDGKPSIIDAEDSYRSGMVAPPSAGAAAAERATRPPEASTSLISKDEVTPRKSSIAADDDEKDDSDAFDFDFSDDDEDQKPKKKK